MVIKRGKILEKTSISQCLLQIRLPVMPWMVPPQTWSPWTKYCRHTQGGVTPIDSIVTAATALLAGMCIGLYRTLLALHSCQSWHHRVIIHLLLGLDSYYPKRTFDTCLRENAIDMHILPTWAYIFEVTEPLRNTLVGTLNLYVCLSGVDVCW